MPPPAKPGTRFPAWLRWAALLWLLVWLPVYWRTWGGANFLHLCDVAVILTCIGLWANSALLISSQAVASLLIDAAWAVAAGSRLIGHPFVPGTEYLLDPSFSLWIRLLTLYHVLMPPLLVWALYRTGYDRRGWVLQSAIALPAFIAARFTSPTDNINFAFTDPFFQRQWGPAPVHIVVSWLFMVIVVYLPTHWLLKRIFPAPVRESRAVVRAAN